MQKTERMSARAGACVRARLAWCRIFFVFVCKFFFGGVEVFVLLMLFCFLFVTKILQCAQYCVRQALALREAGDCRGVRAASLCGDCAACTCTLGSLHVLCAVCRQTGQHTERMAERARSVPRARLVQCRPGARRQGRSAEHAG